MSFFERRSISALLIGNELLFIQLNVTIFEYLFTNSGFRMSRSIDIFLLSANFPHSGAAWFLGITLSHIDLLDLPDARHILR